MIKLHNLSLPIFSIFVFALLFALPLTAVAQDDEPVPDVVITETIEFVEGEGTFDNFLNSILNDFRALLLATVMPAIGLIVVGRNIGKRFLPKTISSAWVELAIIAILFPLYHFANAANATEILQTIVDSLTQLGSLFFVGGVSVVGSSFAYKVAEKHDNTVFGYQRSQDANG